MLYFRRDPVVILALLTGLLQVLSAIVFRWSDEQTGALNAALALAVGLVAAGVVSLDKAVPLVAGLAQALFAVGMAYGFELDPVAQSAIMALIAAVTGAFVRTQVTVSAPPVELAKGV